MKAKKEDRRTLVLSRYGIGVTYRCNSEAFEFGKKCANRDCNKCKDSIAEMSGRDATKLLFSYKKDEEFNLWAL